MQHLTVSCPSCGVSYQLDPELRGKKIRCPNTLCRTPFIVKDDSEPDPPPEPNLTAPPPPQPTDQVTGTVGSMVPLVSIEPDSSDTSGTPSAEDAPKPSSGEKPKFASWDQPPPVRQRSAAPASKPTETPSESTPPKTPTDEPEPTPQPTPEPKEQQSSEKEAILTSEPFAPPPKTEPPKPEPPRTESKHDLLEENFLEENFLEASAASPSEAEPKTEEQPAPETWVFGAENYTPPPVRDGAETPTAEHSPSVDSARAEVGTGQQGETLTLGSDALGDPFEAYNKGKGGHVWIWLTIAGLLVLLGAGVGGAYLLLQPDPTERERRHRQIAHEAYEERKYADAGHLFHLLTQDFPESPEKDEYQFMARFAQAQAPIYEPNPQPESIRKSTNAFLKFLQTHERHDLIRKHQERVWETLQKAAGDLIDAAEKQKKRDLLRVAKAALNELRGEKYKAPEGESRLLAETVDAYKTVERKFLYWRNREQLVKSLEAVQRMSGNVVARSKETLAPFASLHPEIANDPQVKKLLEEMPQLHRQSISYTKHDQSAETSGNLESLPSLLLLRDVSPPARIPDVEKRNVLSIVKGVLYSVDAQTGTLRWAKRIGLDTVSLPIRLPRSSISPERLLVLTNNAEHLMMVRADNGQLIWQRDLGGVCPGKPVLVGPRAFVALDDGRILEIETTEGTLLGEYDVGQRLTGWGVHHRRSSLVYFPAEQDCVFVLDVEKQQCTYIIYSEHPAGSLIGAPIVVPTQPDRTPGVSEGFLVMNEANGLDKVRWRIRSVPPKSAERLSTYDLPGWSWFPPTHHDGKLASVTDNGHFSLLRVVKPMDLDSPFVTRFEETLPSAGGFGDLDDRSQVVSMTNATTWSLIHGRLRKFHAGFYRDGHRVRQLSLKSAYLGTPLHGSETRKREGGNQAFYLTTRRGGSNYLTALDSYSGATLWEKRIGLRVHHPPIVVGQKMVCMIPNGEVILLDRGRFPKGRQSWYDGAKGTTTLPKSYLPIWSQVDPSKKVLWILGSPTKESPRILRLRKIFPTNPKRSNEMAWRLKSPLQGTPAISRVRDGANKEKTWLIIPQENGTLVRKSLDGAVEMGPTWRAAQADNNALGHVVWVRDNHYLVTDGSRGIKQYLWVNETSRMEQANATLEGRILQAPVLLPPKKGGNPRVLLIDKSNKITLWDAIDLDDAPLIREWKFQGELTRGPFPRKNRFGVILNETRLLWFDPSRNEKRWEYTAAAAIVGEPQLIDGKLVVADIAGRVVVVNPKDGKVLKEVEALLPTASPLTTPVAWSPGWTFIPLTDGTAVWWPLDSKKQKKSKPEKAQK